MTLLLRGSSWMLRGTGRPSGLGFCGANNGVRFGWNTVLGSRCSTAEVPMLWDSMFWFLYPIVCDPGNSILGHRIWEHLFLIFFGWKIHIFLMPIFHKSNTSKCWISVHISVPIIVKEIGRNVIFIGTEMLSAIRHKSRVEICEEIRGANRGAAAKIKGPPISRFPSFSFQPFPEFHHFFSMHLSSINTSININITIIAKVCW